MAMVARLQLPSAAQLAAARAMLGLTQLELSARAGVALTTIKRMEAPRTPAAVVPSVRLSSLHRLMGYFETAGIEFHFGPDSTGVSLKEG
jgi:predicted transcriptional regulator